MTENQLALTRPSGSHMPSGPVAPSSFSYAIDTALLRLVVGATAAMVGANARAEE